MKSLFGNGTNPLRKHFLSLLILILLPTLGMSNFSSSAELIYAFYSPTQMSITIKALEKFAKKDVVAADLAIYQKYLPAEQIQKLRRVLVSPIKVHPEAVSQFLYTSQGELILQRLEKVIQTKSLDPKAGFYALRSALIMAAQEPGGLTLLNVLRKYPIRNIHIDWKQTLNIAAELENLINETKHAVTVVTQKSDAEAGIFRKKHLMMSAQLPGNISRFPDFTLGGQLEVKKQTFNFFDLARQRLLVTDIYLPQTRTALPVIFIDHGLGTDSSNFAYLGKHLASYGFAVVVPNHPIGNQNKLRSLPEGGVAEVVEPDEFYHRPLDIKYILNRLEEANQSNSQFQGRLNLQQVGVFGQSLGGYTALALAGAKINFEQIAQSCDRHTLQTTWNMSLLLQCRALELKHQNQSQPYNLQDKRIKAIIAVNPIASTVFGAAGLNHIQVPIMMVASSDDTVAPALYEQILPFSSLVNAHKYLLLVVGGTHFSAIGEGKASSQQVTSPLNLIGDNPQQVRRYMNGLSVPFFQTFVAKKSKYSTYLSAAYTKAIANRSMELSLVRNLTRKELVQIPDSDRN